MKEFLVKYFNSSEQMASQAAVLIKKLAIKNVKEKKFFTLVLSGGKTPETVFSLLAEKEYSSFIPWKSVYVFWGDERCVPPDHPDSNYKSAYDNLLSKIPIPEENIFPMVLNNFKNPVSVAKSYEFTLKKFFDSKKLLLKDKFSSFDLILLGMGTDGHTVSLFPGSKALKEREKWVVSVPAPATATPRIPRITLTYPLINSAKKVLFLISGKDKKELAEKIIHSPAQDINKFPAAGINPAGDLIWYIS